MTVPLSLQEQKQLYGKISSPEPKEWFHDIFCMDRNPFDSREV